MKTPILVMALSLTVAMMNAQDYYAVVKKNDAVTYNYPENTKFTLYDAQNKATKINEQNGLSVTGDYRIEATVSWKDTPDIIESDGGTLEMFTLKNNRSNTLENYVPIGLPTYDDSKDYFKPQLEKKILTASDKTPETYNALFEFTNGMVFQYTDGTVRAYENGKELKVFGNNLIAGATQTLKISYDPKTKEMWYVFEKNKTN